MPLHICVLTSVHRPFDGRIFHRQCVTLARAGYRVSLVAPAAFEQRVEAEVTVLGVPPAANRRERPRVWRHLFRQARRLRPDVIHFHDPELLLLVPLFRGRFGRRVKLVYDVHEYFADSLANKYWLPRPVRLAAPALARRAERALARGVDGIVCAVQAQTSLFSGFEGPVAVVQNLPFAALFQNPGPAPALDGDGLKLIYVGLILPKRGISVLLEAMRLLNRQGAAGVRLFLIGPVTSAPYMEELEQFVQTHRLGEQVRYLGYVPHQKLKDYLHAADVGMAPGLRTRQYQNPGLATKLFEYMLCGLPVVSVDHPHRRVYIQESNCGLVVPPEDPAAYAEAVLWLKNHPARAAEMGRRGRAMVLDHYTWEQEQAQLLAFYRQLTQE